MAHPKRKLNRAAKKTKKAANRTKRGLKKSFRKTGKFVSAGGEIVSHIPGHEEEGRYISDVGNRMHLIGKYGKRHNRPFRV